MIAQFISDNLIKQRKPNLAGEIIEKFFLALRKFYLGLNGTALVHYNFIDSKITLPFRHDLPLNKKQFPEYDMNIGRIPAYLREKYPDIQAIDIGANVGDTAIIIKHFTDIPIPCIEADKFYFTLLKQNTSEIGDIVCENCFVGESKSNGLHFVNYTGSGRLVLSNEPATKILFNSLIEVIERHSNFNKIKFLKIDTDGFDCKIIRSNVDYLKVNKPVIFFEYDPYFLNLIGDDGLSVFSTLSEIGYEKLLIYDNTSVFLISLNIEDIISLEELNLYYSGRQSEMYMDICVFHNDDNDIAETIRKLEFKYFENQKMVKI